MADAEALARRLIDIEARLGLRAPAVKPGPLPVAAPTDGPSDLEAKADILADQSRRVRLEADALDRRVGELKGRQTLRRRAADLDRRSVRAARGIQAAGGQHRRQRRRRPRRRHALPAPTSSPTRRPSIVRGTPEHEPDAHRRHAAGGGHDARAADAARRHAGHGAVARAARPARPRRPSPTSGGSRGRRARQRRCRRSSAPWRRCARAPTRSTGRRAPCGRAPARRADGATPARYTAASMSRPALTGALAASP